MKLSIVIPVFNEAAVIETTYGQVDALMKELLGKFAITDHEIIFVDDGSQDNSLELLKSLAAGSLKVKVISFSRNFGHQPALAAGILYSTGDAVVTLDADLQDPPELIEEMLRKYNMGNDIVYGVRKTRQGDTFFKKATARFFYRVMRLLGVDIIYDHADYRMISRRVVQAFKRIGEFNIFLRGIFPYLGFRHEIVYYDRHERFAGETKYPLHKMLAFAWDGITSFSNVPLRMASFSGLFIFLASLLLSAWAFYTKLIGSTIPGWASIVIPMFFIGGLNILFLGLIGEYIGRIYLEVKGRPLFLMKETHNLDIQE